LLKIEVVEEIGISKFIIFSESRANALENAVNEALKEGWDIINCSATDNNLVAFLIKEGATDAEVAAWKQKGSHRSRRNR
jgi:hypothetical protein